MIYSSLAVIALSASAVINPFTNPVHMHPKPDTRISVTLYNSSASFRDLKIGGQTYTVLSHQKIDIKAPAGTVVYTESRTLTHRRGDEILELSDKFNNQRVNID